MPDEEKSIVGYVYTQGVSAYGRGKFVSKKTQKSFQFNSFRVESECVSD